MPNPQDIIREAADILVSAYSYGVYRHKVEIFHDQAARLRTLLDGVWLDRETAQEILEDAEDVERRGWDIPARYVTIRRQLDEESQR